MKHVKSNELTLKDLLFSMGIIMVVWMLFWYPFEYFVFRQDLTAEALSFLHISREIIRILPAAFFLFHYKDSVKTDFKELFSLKFNNEWFFALLLIFVVDLSVQSYFTKGKVFFDTQKITFYDLICLIALAICQEFVFRGWSFNAFKQITSEKNAAIISSAFYSVSHWFAHFFMFLSGKFNSADFMQVTMFSFIFGIVMCFVIIKTKNKSLVPLIILHAVWDFLTIAMR